MFRKLPALFPMLLLTVCAGVAYAQDVLPTAITSATTTTTTTTPPLPTDVSSYLLGLGPIGALVWGAFWASNVFNKLTREGIKLSVQVEFSPENQKLFERAVESIEERAVRRPRSAS